MRQTQRRSRANNNINYNQITMPWRILLVVVAFALLVPLQVVESKELPDWNEHMLDCFQDMRNADHNHDLKLSSSEFNDFANRYANRLFVSQNVVQRGNFWQLRELFEELCLVNPGDPQGNTLTIAGAEVIQSKAALDDKGSLYLQSKYSPPVYCFLFNTISPFHGQFWFTYNYACVLVVHCLPAQKFVNKRKRYSEKWDLNKPCRTAKVKNAMSTIQSLYISKFFLLVSSVDLQNSSWFRYYD